MSATLYLGLISGTSADAIDAALVAFDPAPRCIAALSHPYPEALRKRILRFALREQAAGLREVGQLETEIGRSFADAATALIDQSGIDPQQIAAVGSHGQTLWHEPEGVMPFTMQLGDANVIAERLRTTTVADFRRRDVAAGGQGAPFAPAFHEACFADRAESRAVLNLGGIANLSLLVPGKPTRGLDTGPASCLMDAWSERHTGSRFDREGQLAESGRVLPDLLSRLLEHPYFQRPAPKSTGRETFQLQWLNGFLNGSEDIADVQATLLQLTVETIAAALAREASACRLILACGGGVHNTYLMARLRQALGSRQLRSTAEFGVDPDFVEAMLIAWLARERIEGRPVRVAATTGAIGPRVLGAIYAP